LAAGYVLKVVVPELVFEDLAEVLFEHLTLYLLRALVDLPTKFV